MDLRHSLIPDELISDMIKSMPEHKGPDLLGDRGMSKYDYVSFMERYLDIDRALGEDNLEPKRSDSLAPTGLIYDRP